MRTHQYKLVISFDVGSRNLACCVASITNSGVTTILHWDVHDITATSKSDTLVNLFSVLDEVLDNVSTHMPMTVLIENQPSRTSGIMKAIQHGIVSYFAMRRYQRGETVTIKEVSARVKLDGRLPCALRSTYRDRKKASVDCVTMLTRGHQALEQKLQEYPKKDDLCDAFLYLATPKLTGFVVLSNNNHFTGPSTSWSFVPNVDDCTYNDPE